MIILWLHSRFLQEWGHKRLSGEYYNWTPMEMFKHKHPDLNMTLPSCPNLLSFGMCERWPRKMSVQIEKRLKVKKNQQSLRLFLLSKAGDSVDGFYQ